MWRKPESKDEETQVLISRVTRKMNRKTFLNKFAQRTAEALAKVLVRPDDDDIVKISFAAGPCRPPHGQYCTGCGSDASCPSDYVICTPKTVINDCKGLCPYPSGWWYTSDPVGHRAKCQDCISQYVHPYVGRDWCYQGARVYGRYVICACRSTEMY
ncbi:hypothetical protein V4V36_01140 [Paenibacillus lautus]|jgi:hypothetical protein|uniref:hypothetical protein n=1 Tax=Paenibacillus lautus TaxID=1401 RepID=UPI0010DE2AD0|nr:hypothetical protein [Paenibacillus lautus]MBY0161449.1 hypothetical protein [Cytobacillus firmus]MCI1777543.1 hypothetical protein [Paenibacillus lautus]VTR26995.1 Uncharacterised protein [Actinobacillus pleuropneumoniae]